MKQHTLKKTSGHPRLHYLRMGLAGLAGLALVGVILLTLSQPIGAAQAANIGQPATNVKPVPPSPAARDVVLKYFREQDTVEGFVPADLVDLVVTDEYVSAHNGVTHIYLRQRVNGLDIVNAVANANVTPKGAILGAHQSFVPSAADQAPAAMAVKRLSAVEGVNSAAEQLGLPTASFTVLQQQGGPAQAVRLSGGILSQDDIPARLVFFGVQGKNLRLAWDIVIHPLDGQHWWNVQVDAETGEILAQADWVSNETYNVVPFPAESPSHGEVAITVDPYLSNTVASPYGWHDTNGVVGPEYTVTRGNNVWAKEDWNGDDEVTLGLQPDGGSSLMFTNTIDFSEHPTTYITSSVINLFYWNNIAHDLLYSYGFDTASGNFQANTYGGGGLGGDAVMADAQDNFAGGSINNANFGTPPDGIPGRMQMFVWTERPPNQVTVNTPPAIAGDYATGSAAFGGYGTLTATVALVDDGVDTATDGCSEITNNVAGQIALIDRGGCSFVIKARNAQNAGAIGVIIANNVAGDPPLMSGTGADITIPVASISQADGVTFKGNSPINATLVVPEPSTPRDSSFDAGIVLHEYSHGVSNRLTGGPSDVGCLNTSESAGMGEGWSDFLALAFLAQPGSTGSQARSVGTYAAFQPITGVGIRHYPYSTDLGINPLTYADMPTTGNEVHYIGEIWASMLWDLHWAYVDQYGFSADMYNGTAGNNQVIQLVLDGMKFQPCLPSFTDARDALLEADRVNTGGVNQRLIWQVFARRGLGANADSGNLFDETDGTADFSMPSALDFKFYRPPTLGYPEQNYTYMLDVNNLGVSMLTGVVITAQVPTNATYVPGSASNGGVETNGLIQWDIGTLITNGLCLTRTFEINLPAALNLSHTTLSTTPWSWTTTQTDAPGWTQVVDQGHRVWYASEPGVPSQQVLTLATPITVPDSGLLKLSHRYHSESYFGGGVVEISNDNGTTWIDVGPLMTLNGYNLFIDSTSTDDVYIPMPAFGGDSAGYIQTEIDLGSYAGQSVQLRFRFLTDMVDNEGWYIDADKLLWGPSQPQVPLSARAQDSDGISVTLHTTMTVQSTALLADSDIPVASTQLVDQQITRAFTLTNTGGVPLFFDLSGMPAWLTVSPVSGAIPARSALPFSTVFNSTGLTAGTTYTGTLSLNNDNTFNAPNTTLPVVLNVYPDTYQHTKIYLPLVQH